MDDLNKLDIVISRMRGIPAEHLEDMYMEGATENGDGWEGWYCPRCGVEVDLLQNQECYIRWSRSWEKAGILLDEMMAAGVRFSLYEEDGKYHLTLDWISAWGGETGPEVIARAYREWRSANDIIGI